MLSLRRNGVRRIAYIDIDAHHCDGVAVGFHGDPECLMVSVHEERLWPRTGLIDDDAGGAAINLPVPRRLNDTEMAYIRDHLIRPQVEAFRPEAVVFLCGADGVEEDPLAHLSLSNNAHWDVARALMGTAPRLLVLGGGGYNPWSVGRLWTGVWATLNGYDIPERLPPEAEAVLRALKWENTRRGRNPPDHWFTTLRDAPRPGPLRAEVVDRVAYLNARPRRA
jgi:acetoin utilization protein AcuC